MTGHMCLYEESSVLEYFRNKKDHYRGSKENGIKENHVRSILSKTRKKLKKYLEEGTR